VELLIGEDGDVSVLETSMALLSALVELANDIGAGSAIGCKGSILVPARSTNTDDSVESDVSKLDVCAVTELVGRPVARSPKSSLVATAVGLTVGRPVIGSEGVGVDRLPV
jgi:hypothetical protein